MNDTQKRSSQGHRDDIVDVVAGSSIPTLVIDRNHVVTHWNKALEKWTGYAAEDIVGTSNYWKAFYRGQKPILADFIVDEASEAEIKKYYGDIARELPLVEGAYEAEDYNPHLMGGTWLYFIASPLKNENGEVVGAVEHLWGTTETRKLQIDQKRRIRQLSSLLEITNALSGSLDLEERFEAAVKSIIKHLNVDSVGIYLKENDGFYCVYSYGYKTSFYRKGSRLSPEGKIGETVRREETLFYEDIVSANEFYRDYVIKEGLKSSGYIPLSSKEGIFGAVRLSSHTAYPFSEEDKNLFSLIGNRIAIALENARLHQELKEFSRELQIKVREKTTKLKESYRKLRRSEENYRTMFDDAPSPIIVLEKDSLAIVDVNATAIDCYGYSRLEFFKISFTDLGTPLNRQILEGINRLSFNRTHFYPKMLFKRKDGRTFYVNLHIRPVTFLEKNYIIVTTPDVDDHVQRETQLIQASKMATLGTMASGIAHEINQPLNVIQVCSDYLMKVIGKGGDELPKDDIREMAREIQQNVKRAAQTIRHMKDFSRQSAVRSSRLNINDPIRDVFKILGQQLRVHDIDVVLDLSQELPLILADHNRLEQVFMNLVDNAKDTLDESGKMEESDQRRKEIRIASFVLGDRVVATVTDNGMGMSDDVKDKLFEPFFTTKDVGKGTGLGISISYGIVKDYKGTIDVESVPMEGTTFTLTFPIAP